MCTRLSGRARDGSPSCTRHAKSILAFGLNTTSPSIPAVLRPALRSVTRRTPNSALARERSINFCRLRTRFRSPALLAVKIRWRKRRTLSSQARQSTASQCGVASPGPFAATVTASNLPFGSGAIPSCSSQAHLTASAPFRVRAQTRIRPVIRGRQLEVPTRYPAFPLPFGYRHSLLGHPIPARELRLPHGRPTGPQGPDPDGVTTFRTHEPRPGWMPPVPRGRRCSPDQHAFTGRRLPLPSDQSLHPPHNNPSAKGVSSRGINGGSRDSPVRSPPRL